MTWSNLPSHRPSFREDTKFGEALAVNTITVASLLRRLLGLGVGQVSVVRSAFDVDFYLSNNPDVADTEGIDPVEHYCRHGWKEGRDPSPNFSTRSYLESNPDVASAGINPFYHYLAFGMREGRAQHVRNFDFHDNARRAHADRHVPNARQHSKSEMETIGKEFDAKYYLSQNPDVADAGVDPLRHFVQIGWREGRSPAPGFSVPYYLEANPDVAHAGINPFWHYLVAGRAEGRMACHPGGRRAEGLTKLLPLEERVKAWRSKPAPDQLLDSEALTALVIAAAETRANTLFVSISHDNYHEEPGGVQFCMLHEEAVAGRRGHLYLTLHPYHPLPRLAHADEDPDPAVEILLAGKRIGTAKTSAVVSSVSRLANHFAGIEVIVHQLLGHSPERITELIAATGQNKCWFWLHDFFSVCTSFTLRRNDVSLCGAPPVGSNACTLCVYGQERVSHLERLRTFFETVDVHAIAPSEFMAKYWADRADLPVASLSAYPHMTIDWTKTRARISPDTETDLSSLTIGFAGTPAVHKGWPVFVDLVQQLRSKDLNVNFVCFGVQQVGIDAAERIPVQVTADDPDAMVDAISARGVDFILHWATWPETFSFTTFEALAGGAFILTNADSGNVAETVRRTGRGLILKDREDLIAAFGDGRLHRLALEARALRRSQQAMTRRSDMIFTVLDARAAA